MTAPPAVPSRLMDLGERRIFAELIEPRYRTVPSFGDDCAALGADRVITTDSCDEAMVVSGLGIADQTHTGWLLVTMNLSDLAAAGAEPEGLVVNYTLPKNTPVSTLKKIMDGVDAAAAEHGTRVLGGDIGEGTQLRLSATAVGRCPPRQTATGPVSSRLGRHGAGPGDRLLLLGHPGYLWAAALLHHGCAQLADDREAQVYERACRPLAQLVGGRLLAAEGLARAATDISDGLFAGVRNLCRANRLGARVSAAMKLDDVLLEVCAQAAIDPFQLGQTWGDWCLLVAVAERDTEPARTLLDEAGVTVREVGVLTRAVGELNLDDGAGGLAPWRGVDQERFSDTSWRAGGVEAELERMRGRSARPGPLDT